MCTYVHMYIRTYVRTYIRTYVCTSVAGSLEAQRGVPIDLTRQREGTCTVVVLSYHKVRGGATITRPRSLEQPGPGAHG